MGTKKIHMYRLRIKELAEKRGITRTKLARMSDVQYETINGIWQNSKRDVSLTTLMKIAKALNVPVTELFEAVDNEEDE